MSTKRWTSISWPAEERPKMLTEHCDDILIQSVTLEMLQLNQSRVQPRLLVVPAKKCQDCFSYQSVDGMLKIRVSYG